MSPKWMLIPLLLFLSCWCYSQNGLPSTYGGKSIAMGGTGVTFQDVNALLNNQAGLAGIDRFTAIISAEQRFAAQELQSLAAGIVIPTALGGTFGLSLNYFGFDLYNEQRIGLAYSRKLFPELSIGAQFLLHHTQIEEYGSRVLPAVEFGLIYDVTQELSIGAHLFNPMRIEVLPEEFLPTVLRIGLSYEPSEKALFLAEVSKDIEYPVQARAGIEYRLVEQLVIRSGIQTAPEQWSFGLGYWLKEQRLQLDVSAAHHQFLGFTPGISLSLRPS